MTNLSEPDEFIGRFGISYQDGDVIYAYDDITYGLYKFTLNMNKVTLVLSPADIHRSTNDRIMGISKSGSEIVLIPLYIDEEWVFYDVEKERVRYCRLIESPIGISGVVTIDRHLFLIPSNIDDPIAIFSLDDMRKIKVHENWCPVKFHKVEKGRCLVWGAVSYGNLVFFPIVGTNCICYLDSNRTHFISLKMESSILSVGVSENRIWVLPENGDYIYEADFEGNIINRISLCREGVTVSTSSFIRIIPIKEAVFLLPAYGSNIYVYQYEKDRVVQIESTDDPLRGSLFVPGAVSFWNFILGNNKLYLLPSVYSYRSIDLLTLECSGHGLTCGDGMNSSEYWKMIVFFPRNRIIREKQGDLKEFIQFELCADEKHSREKSIEAGKQIWEAVR